MHRIVVFLLALLLGAANGLAALPDWSYDGAIRVPFGSSVLFLACDRAGEVYGTTSNPASTPGEVYAFKVLRSRSSTPQVTVFDHYTAPPGLGYTGITVDDWGNVYVALDQGPGTPSRIRKYDPALRLDPRFGENGAFETSAFRIGGLTSWRGQVIAAITGSRILVLKTDGSASGGSPLVPADRQAPISDIDIIPSTQEIVAVGPDSIFMFSGGSVADPQGYTFWPFMQGISIPENQPAVHYSPYTDRIYHTVSQGLQLGSVARSGRQLEVLETVGTEEGALLPWDAASSPDGKLLFISDRAAPSIYRYRRRDINVVVGVPRAAGAGAQEIGAAPSLELSELGGPSAANAGSAAEPAPKPQEAPAPAAAALPAEAPPAAAPPAEAGPAPSLSLPGPIPSVAGPDGSGPGKLGLPGAPKESPAALPPAIPELKASSPDKGAQPAAGAPATSGSLTKTEATSPSLSLPSGGGLPPLPGAASPGPPTLQPPK